MVVHEKQEQEGNIVRMSVMEDSVVPELQEKQEQEDNIFRSQLPCNPMVEGRTLHGYVLHNIEHYLERVRWWTRPTGGTTLTAKCSN